MKYEWRYRDLCEVCGSLPTAFCVAYVYPILKEGSVGSFFWGMVLLFLLLVFGSDYAVVCHSQLGLSISRHDNALSWSVLIISRGFAVWLTIAVAVSVAALFPGWAGAIIGMTILGVLAPILCWVMDIVLKLFEVALVLMFGRRKPTEKVA